MRAHGRERGAKAACLRYSCDEVSSRRHENVRPFRDLAVCTSSGLRCGSSRWSDGRNEELLQPLSRLALSLSRLGELDDRSAVMHGGKANIVAVSRKSKDESSLCI